MTATTVLDLRDGAAVAATQNALLRRMVDLTRRTHPFYRDRWADAGVDLDRVRSIEDLPLLPTTSKDDLAADSARFVLRTSDLGEDRPPYSDLWDVVYTSGSTGRPVAIHQAAYDFFGILLLQRRMAEIRGMTGDDRIFVAYPITRQPHGAYLRANHAAVALGLEVVNGFGGADDDELPITSSHAQVVDRLVAASPTVLWGVPTYLRLLLQDVADRGAGLPDLRMMAVSGEPCSDALARSLVARAREAAARSDVMVSNSLGASELQCGLVECVPGAGFHNPAPELFAFECVDDAGATVPDGEFGQLCVTHLDRRGTVLFRYLLGDFVTVSHDACPHCGRFGGRVTGHRGRLGSALKIRGNFVDLRVVDDLLQQCGWVHDHRIRISTDAASGLDVLGLEVWPRPDAAVGEDETAALAAQVRAAINLRPVVRVQRDPDEAPGTASGQLKTKRLIDER
jgi:phenylacetate-CoA ligase